MAACQHYASTNTIGIEHAAGPCTANSTAHSTRHTRASLLRSALRGAIELRRHAALLNLERSEHQQHGLWRQQLQQWLQNIDLACAVDVGKVER